MPSWLLELVFDHCRPCFFRVRVSAGTKQTRTMITHQVLRPIIACDFPQILDLTGRGQWTPFFDHLIQQFFLKFVANDECHLRHYGHFVVAKQFAETSARSASHVWSDLLRIVITCCQTIWHDCQTQTMTSSLWLSLGVLLSALGMATFRWSNPGTRGKKMRGLYAARCFTPKVLSLFLEKIFMVDSVCSSYCTRRPVKTITYWVPRRVWALRFIVSLQQASCHLPSGSLSEVLLARVSRVRRVRRRRHLWIQRPTGSSLGFSAANCNNNDNNYGNLINCNSR